MSDQPIQLLEDLEAEFARVAAEHEAGRQRRGRRGRAPWAPRHALAVATAAVVLAVGGYAVPSTRAAIDDLARSFAAWVFGDESRAPGRSLRPTDDAPEWLRDEAARVIAQNHGIRLYVSRAHTASGTQLRFTLGNGGAAISDSLDGWRERLGQHSVVVLGPAGINGRPWDEHGHFALLGLTARSVTRVQLRYASGPATTVNGVHGGFVLLADARRPLRDLVAYDRAGHELERTDVSYIHLRAVCFDERGCPPGRLTRP
jgi:hypothetical protein